MIYKKTFTGVIYSHTFNISLIIMALATALIIIGISSNVLLSLGMVGALSIVRFRTPIKDPMDIVYIFGQSLLVYYAAQALSHSRLQAPF